MWVICQMKVRSSDDGRQTQGVSIDNVNTNDDDVEIE